MPTTATTTGGDDADAGLGRRGRRSGGRGGADEQAADLRRTGATPRRSADLASTSATSAPLDRRGGGADRRRRGRPTDVRRLGGARAPTPASVDRFDAAAPRCDDAREPSARGGPPLRRGHRRRGSRSSSSRAADGTTGPSSTLVVDRGDLRGPARRPPRRASRAVDRRRQRTSGWPAMATARSHRPPACPGAPAEPAPTATTGRRRPPTPSSRRRQGPRQDHRPGHQRRPRARLRAVRWRRSASTALVLLRRRCWSALLDVYLPDGVGRRRPHRGSSTCSSAACSSVAGLVVLRPAPAAGA